MAQVTYDVGNLHVNSGLLLGLVLLSFYYVM